MNLTEYGRLVIERAMSTRMMTRSLLVEVSGVPASVVDMFTAGKTISQDSFNTLCKTFGIEPALICEVQERPFPSWLSLFLRDFCYPMSVGADGFTYLVRGERFQPVISAPIGVQIKFVGHICVMRMSPDSVEELECFDIPEDGELFIQKLTKAVSMTADGVL